MKKPLIIMMLLLLGLLTACNAKKAPTQKLTYTTSPTSITIVSDEKIEYSIDNGKNWISGENVKFDSLTPNTEYVILYRFKKTDKDKASENAKETVRTKTLSNEGAELDKILVIGNQNSADILDVFYETVIKSDIEENLILGFVTKENETLNNYSENALDNKNSYTYTKQTSLEDPVVTKNYSIADVVADEPWDLIIVEQTNEFGGVLKEYTPHLNNLTEFIRSNALNENVEVAFNMPWAYHRDSEHAGFANYRNNQERMYNGIVSRMNDSVINNVNIEILIPTGTTLQNLRTTVIGDNLTLEDGERLNQVGKAAASLVWVKQLFNKNLDELNLEHFNLDEDTLGAIFESIDNAYDKPLEITKSTNFSNPYKDKLYMLSIGNSFTQDAYVYLAQMLLDIGIKDFVIGYLYAGGASLSLHLGRIKDDTTYEQYRIWHNSATAVTTDNQTIKGALSEYEWDIVTVQQVSSDSGIALSFQNSLTPLMQQIKANNPNDENTKYGYHMTWAYTDHWEFGRYNNDQLYMYEQIVAATQKMVIPNQYIDFIIPAGTAIQNLRKAMNKDEITRDGYHLNGLGQYTAGLMWAKVLTNIDLSVITYQPEGINVIPNIGLIHRSVDNAYNKPYELS